MKIYRKNNVLYACTLLTMALLSTSCNSIDDNLDDCFIDLQAEYELHLVTNENHELARVLADHPGIAEALQQHLSGVFSDQGRDLNLSFYNSGTRSYQQTEAMNNASTKQVHINLPIKDYEHLAIANIQGNDVISLENDNSYAHTSLSLNPQSSTLNDSEVIIDSQKTGIFTGRRSFLNMTWGTYPYRMPLYMVNCADAIVLDPRTALFTDVRVCTRGFADSFSVSDSLFHYDKSTVTRSERVTLNNTDWLCFCSVNFPSHEPSATTRSRIEIDEPRFLYEDCGEDIWYYDCYVTMADGSPNGLNIKAGSITKTTLAIRHPLRPGQLKVILGWIDDRGIVHTDDQEVGVSIDLDWKPGIEFEW